MNYTYEALRNNCLLLWELDSLTLEVLGSLTFRVCLFDHNSGKGAWPFSSETETQFIFIIQSSNPII